jgi:hypothetical protein
MKRVGDRIGWAISGALAVALLMSLASVARGGSLDPTAPPGSTMRTLEELQPAWNQKLSATGGCDSPRFDCIFFSGSPLFVDLAVFDRETGLVWQRNPAEGFVASWGEAAGQCRGLQLAGRYGWRLPTVEELSSLIENDAMPAGHPFLGDVNSTFWTSTAEPGLPDYAAIVAPWAGFVSATTKTTDEGVWCVRSAPVDTGQP